MFGAADVHHGEGVRAHPRVVLVAEVAGLLDTALVQVSGLFWDEGDTVLKTRNTPSHRVNTLGKTGQS